MPAGPGAARASIGWDFLYIAGYVVVGPGSSADGGRSTEAPKLKSAERVVIALPAVVGALDVVENMLILAGLGVDDGRLAYPSHLPLPITIATIGWTKWFIAAVVVVTVVMALMLAFARRGEPHRPRVQLGPSDEPGPVPAPSGLGVCCSGGGIRAAAFAVGALDRLETAGVMARARWLTAVSGGSYAATAWRLVRATNSTPGRGGHHRLAGGTSTRKSPWSSPVPSQRPGRAPRPVFSAVLYIGFNVAVLGALVYALAWPLGWVIGSNAVQPVLRQLGGLPDQLDVPAELWLPGLLVAAAGAVVLAVSALPSWTVATWWRLAALLGGARPRPRDRARRHPGGDGGRRQLDAGRRRSRPRLVDRHRRGGGCRRDDLAPDPQAGRRPTSVSPSRAGRPAPHPRRDRVGRKGGDRRGDGQWDLPVADGVGDRTVAFVAVYAFVGTTQVSIDRSTASGCAARSGSQGTRQVRCTHRTRRSSRRGATCPLTGRSSSCAALSSATGSLRVGCRRRR